MDDVPPLPVHKSDLGGSPYSWPLDITAEQTANSCWYQRWTA
ncbi:hypothetical protein STRIP9103_09492 [Streptomyces ipomoeae 91-03]|uniref:Uncharacterized protein n=1 Tax=Streptomyces ipomoeae 91-03 TaxID=698759 RepID=L1L4X1_9ACTN|nr:hypothetical protein STRIP9103_09492 [Streptomyces ipomoeae 91-03]